MRTLPLDDATRESSGSKASTLAALSRAGIDIPDGFVIPMSEYRRHHAETAGRLGQPPDTGLVNAIEAHVRRLLGGADAGYVAVRSSASDEDGDRSSSAGQHDTVLAVRGTQAVAAAVARCWASLHSSRATAYRQSRPSPADRPPAMAVLVQRHIDADVSGVLFTGTPRVIEATPGLGAPLVSGEINPDAWTLDDAGVIARRAGAMTHRLDRSGGQLLPTPLLHTGQMCLDDGAVLEVDQLGKTVTQTLRYEVDLEWAMTGRRIHVLQARPITAPLTPRQSGAHGIPASPGFGTGIARVLRGPRDFHHLQLGDIIICRATDPAWTPLFAQAAGIITETGGLLSHAAIVARELRIPAILSVPHATTSYPNGTSITMDGATGHIKHGSATRR